MAIQFGSRKSLKKIQISLVDLLKFFVFRLVSAKLIKKHAMIATTLLPRHGTDIRNYICLLVPS